MKCTHILRKSYTSIVPFILINWLSKEYSNHSNLYSPDMSAFRDSTDIRGSISFLNVAHMQIILFPHILHTSENIIDTWIERKMTTVRMGNTCSIVLTLIKCMNLQISQNSGYLLRSTINGDRKQVFTSLGTWWTYYLATKRHVSLHLGAFGHIRNIRTCRICSGWAG